MAKFLNKANDEIIETEDADDEQLFAEAEAKGFMPIADITDKTTGETHVIPRSELKEALNSGRFIIPQLYEAQQEEKRVQQEETNPVIAAGIGFAKSATMGAAPAVGGLKSMAEGGTYKAGREKYEQRQEAASEAYPTSYGLGYTAGVLPGMAAKGVTTLGQIGLGAVAPLIGQAAKVDEPITKERALELGGDVAGGAVLGGVGGLAAERVEPFAKSMAGMAERRAVKATGADVLRPQRRIERMPGGRQAFGRDLLESGIVTAGSTVPKMKTKAQELAKASGDAIGSSMRNFDKKIGVPAVSRQALLSEIETVPAALAENPATVSLAKRLESSFIEPMREWAAKGEAATLEEVWEIRRKLDDLAWSPTGIDKPLDKQLQKVRKLMEDRLQKSALDAGISPEEMAQYQKAKRMYQVSSETVQTTGAKIDRMQANRAVSPSDYFSGGSAATVGAVVGGVPGATLGAILGTIGNNLARKRGPQVAAVTMDKLSKMMKTNPDRFRAIIANFMKTGAMELGDDNE